MLLMVPSWDIVTDSDIAILSIDFVALLSSRVVCVCVILATEMFPLQKLQNREFAVSWSVKLVRSHAISRTLCWSFGDYMFSRNTSFSFLHLLVPYASWNVIITTEKAELIIGRRIWKYKPNLSCIKTLLNFSQPANLCQYLVMVHVTGAHIYTWVCWISASWLYYLSGPTADSPKFRLSTSDRSLPSCSWCYYAGVHNIVSCFFFQLRAFIFVWFFSVLLSSCTLPLIRDTCVHDNKLCRVLA